MVYSLSEQMIKHGSKNKRKDDQVDLFCDIVAADKLITNWYYRNISAQKLQAPVCISCNFWWRSLGLIYDRNCVLKRCSDLSKNWNNKQKQGKIICLLARFQIRWGIQLKTRDRWNFLFSLSQNIWFAAIMVHCKNFNINEISFCKNQ